MDGNVGGNEPTRKHARKLTDSSRGCGTMDSAQGRDVSIYRAQSPG